MSEPPSGAQHEITYGEQRATVVEVGGGIREYVHGDRAVLDPYPLDAICDGAHGTVLVPWPNRLADGRYRFDGVDYQVPLSEPARANASHGFLRWRSWTVAEHAAARVVVQSTLHPMPFYPFALHVSVAYALGEDGLRVTSTATNVGERACPYGFGQHPYLAPGDGALDDCLLELAAATSIVVDERRKLPVGREPVAGTPLDFATPTAIGERRIDVALTDLARDEHGRATARLTGSDARTVELWADEHHRFLQLYTGDDLAPARRRRGLALEPMTCAPNAFQSGEGLMRIEPGESVATSWGVRLES